MKGPRLRLPGSIRFRLTAWYALLLALVLTVLGVLVLQLTEERLKAEGEAQLEKTAQDVRAAVEVNQSVLIAALDWRRDVPYSLRSTEAFRETMDKSLRRFAGPDMRLQIVDATDKVLIVSEFAPQRAVLLPRRLADQPGQLSVGTAQLAEGDVRVARIPVRFKFDGQEFIVGGVLVGEPIAELYGQSTIDALRRILLGTSVGGLAFAICGGWLLAGRALKPVDRVTAAAAQIARGDGTAASLTTRLPVSTTGDEIARLSSTFNAMLDRLEGSFRAQQRFVADASHELRTPLTAIRGNVEVLGRQLAALEADPRAKGDLEAGIADVQRESARMGRLVDDLLFLVRTDAPSEGAASRARPLRLDDLARDAVRTARPLAAGQELAVVAPAPVAVAGDDDRLRQLLLILLDNALRHTAAGKAVAVEVVPPDAAGLARLVVRDEGEGIAPEHLPHLFDRFYRADGARGRATGGTGLGLAIAHAIVRAHGGRITVSSQPGAGSTFAVALPAVPVPAALPAAAPEEGSPLPALGDGTKVVARTG